MNGDEEVTESPQEHDVSVSNGSEQNEQHALLTEWKSPYESDGEKGAGVLSESKKGRSFPIRLAFVCVSLFLALLATAGSLLAPSLRKDVGAALNENIEVNRADGYNLDPTWDFDALPQRREFTWTIRDHIHNPDGIYRSMILANNQFPGPLIEVNEGDTIIVHVHNQAVNATAIHWHGIYQRGTPHMDGTIGVTQCPIPPGGQFTYEFRVDGQSGTYWWHGHHGMQAADGLYGPLIVHSPKEKTLQKVRYASDRIILVSDHYHDLSSALLWQYLKPDVENVEPIPDSGLLNGQNVLDCDLFPDRRCDNSTANVGYPVFDFARNQKHRIRFINVGSFAEFQLQIDGHELAVTEVDGTDVQPVNYHRIKISPAQRYSVVLDTSQSGTGLFWLRARMTTTCFKSPPKNLNTEVRAIVRYEDQTKERPMNLPTSVDWELQLDDKCKDMNTSQLKPVEVISTSFKADNFFYLRSNFEIGAYRLSRGFFNGSSWRPNVRSPSLFRSIDGLSTDNVSYTSTSSLSPFHGSAAFVNDVAFQASRELVIQTTGVQTIDLLISNFDDGSHPLHLHGYKYLVLAQGHGYPPLVYTGADITAENLAPLYSSLDLSNPLRRDTASVEGFGWILLRVVADNPGMWAFHCHVSWHSESGLLMQFLTRSDALSEIQIPAESQKLCSASGLERGMAPDDAMYQDFAK